MGLISEESIRQVIAASDIVEVINSYFPLKRAGNAWRALCPFHREKTPSFYVNPIHKTFHCFGCGASGTVVRFIMNYEQISFPTAIQRLAQSAGISILEFDKKGKFQNEHMRLLLLHTEATCWFHANLLTLPAATQARQYLKSRGFSKGTVLRWKIGYAPASWNAFSEWAISQGFSRQELLHSGLVSQGEGIVNFHDRFLDRIMFPIHSTLGEVIAFSGRIVGEVTSKSKYLNSPETLLFSKGRVLFGLDKTKHALIKSEEAVVCEGQVDLISCFEAGIHNVVASQGSVLTREQAFLLKRYNVKQVLLCFDADPAGQQAIERSITILCSCEFAIKVVRIPHGEDPDSAIRKAGPQVFRNLLFQSADYFDFAIDQATEDGSLNPFTQVALARKFAAILHGIDTLALREALSIKIASRLGISLRAFTQLFEKKPQYLLPHKEVVPPPTSVISFGEGQKLLCRLALFSPEVKSWLLEQTCPSIQEIFPDTPLLKKILTSNVALNDPLSFNVFLESLEPAETNTVLAWGGPYKIPETPLLTAIDCWWGMVRNYLKARQASAKVKLKNVHLTSEARLTIQKEFLDLQQRLQDILPPFPVCNLS